MSKAKEIRQKGVKRYSVQGVTYTYHRATGARLPDCSFSSHRFKMAFREAESQAANQPPRIIEPAPRIARSYKIGDFLPPQMPDAVAFSLTQCINFIFAADSGKILLYHSGDLLADASKDSMVKARQRYLHLVSTFDLIHLRQSRVSEGWSHYYAVKTNEPLTGMPQNAVSGRIGADDFTALTAVNERQSAIATSRAIRDALGISDIEAAEMRNQMIRAGG